MPGLTVVIDGLSTEPLTLPNDGLSTDRPAVGEEGLFIDLFKSFLFSPITNPSFQLISWCHILIRQKKGFSFKIIINDDKPSIIRTGVIIPFVEVIGRREE